MPVLAFFTSPLCLYSPKTLRNTGNGIPRIGYGFSQDGIICIAGLVHVENQDLPLAFRRMSEALKPGGYLLVSVRYGTGRMEERSVTEIDGQTYDRNFIAHNEEELRSSIGEDLVLVRELPSDMKIWAYYLLQKIGEVGV